MRILSPVAPVLLLVQLTVLSAGDSPSSTTPCGKRNVLPFAFVYGSDAFRGQFPWHVAIYNNEPNRNPEYICDGAIVSRSVVVTAAHCLDDWQRPQQYSFITGLFDHQNLTATSSYNVSEIILHPEFNRSTLINDIAVLRSDGDIAYTHSTVLPICLPRGDAAVDFTVGKAGLVAGWESPHIKRKSITLQSTTVVTIDAESCKKKMPHYNHFQLDNSTVFCARGRKSYDKICSANGGGGLFNNHDGLSYLRGIVSFTPRREMPDGSIGCDPDGILGFTDVTRYTKWVDEHLNQSEKNWLLQHSYVQNNAIKVYHPSFFND